MGWLWVLGSGILGVIVLHFNSTMGWLWACPRTAPCNSYRISIPLWDDCEAAGKDKKTRPVGFQFHYGMIVRERMDVARQMREKFQFHYGMIVRLPSLKLPTLLPNFNSTMGWLWAEYKLTEEKIKLNFNSTMGWLWVPCAPATPVISVISIPLWDDCEGSGSLWCLRPKKFQFHYGMIVRSPINLE